VAHRLAGYQPRAAEHSVLYRVIDEHRCGGRRMTEGAARLVDGILPHVPVRQWVLSLPHRLRYLIAWDHKLCRAVLCARVLLSFQRRRARRRGLRAGHSGCVTVIQRFGGGLNLNVHFHTLVLDGVSAPATADGRGGRRRPRNDLRAGVPPPAPSGLRRDCRRSLTPGSDRGAITDARGH